MEERIMGENVTQNNNVANGKKKSKVKWIVIAVVAIIIIAAIANGGSGDSNDVKKVDSKSSTKTEAKKDNTPETTKEKTSFNVGETAEYKNIQITLEKVITDRKSVV